MKAYLRDNNDIDRAAWDLLVAESDEGSPFVQTWYLDIIAPGWQGIIVYDADVIVAVMPMDVKSKYFISYALQPILAKYWGLCFRKTEHHTTYKEYSWKKQVLEVAIQVLPPGLKSFGYNFHPNFDYPLPFHWVGYSLDAKYTFRLDLQRPYEEIRQNFQQATRKFINRAVKEGITIKEDKTPDNLLKMLELNRKNGKEVIPVMLYPQLEKIYTAGISNGNAIGFSAWYEGKAIASALIVFDKKTAYSLLANMDPAYKEMEAMQLLMAEIIREMQSRSESFDFCGLMVKNFEQFWRKFGPIPVPYLFVSKMKFPLNILPKK